MRVWLIALSFALCLADKTCDEGLPSIAIVEYDEVANPDPSKVPGLFQLLASLLSPVTKVVKDPETLKKEAFARALGVGENHFTDYKWRMDTDPQYKESELQLVDEAETVVTTLPFADQFRFGHYITRKMMAEEESIRHPWIEYMVTVAYPSRLKDGKKVDCMACGNIAYIMAHMVPTDPLWLKLAYILVKLELGNKEMPDFGPLTSDAEFLNADVKSIIELHAADYQARLIVEPDYQHSQRMLWKAAEHIPTFPFMDQMRFGDYVIRKVMAEDESVWRPFLEHMLLTDVRRALRIHKHTSGSIGNMAYVISQLRPTDPLWIEAVRSHILLLNDIKNK
jgi:hypothetical protein